MIFSVSSQFSFAIKDMAGTMSPYEAEHLIKGIKDAVGDVPVVLHTHCTTGMAYMTVLKAIESGLDVVDTAISCFSGGTAQPATETPVLCPPAIRDRNGAQ